MTTRLRVSRLTTSYPNFILEDVDFILESGDIMGLVGKSGSGKSTLIKTLIGLKQPDSGSQWVTVDGDEKKIKNVLGYSPQENSLYPFLTIRENLHTFGQIRNCSKDEIEKRGKRLLAELDVKYAIDRKVSELSGGMKKRADIATTLLHSPKLVILDEPFAGIDPPQRKIIWNLIQKNASEGTIFIITSHLVKDLAANCDKYGLVHDGSYHNSEQMMQMMADTDYNRLESFLEDVFRL